MNDFDYDVMQKKRIARGAFHKVNGSKSKGCRLPHENLTKKEREALNGEIKTVSMMQPIAWELFTNLPKDLQEEYLDTQVRRFGVGLRTIGQDMFGLGNSTLNQYVQRHGLHVIPAPNGQTPKAAKESWKRWLYNGTKIAPINETADVPQVTMCEEAFNDIPYTTTTAETKPEPEVKPFRAHDFEDMFKEMGMEREPETDGRDQSEPDNENIYPLTDLSLTLKGTPIDILTTLRMSFPALLDKDKSYRFSIKVDGYVL